MGWGDMDTDPEGAPRVDVPAGQQRGGVRVPRAEAQRARRQGHARRRRLARRVRLARAAPQRALVVAAVRPHLQQLHLILLPYHIRSHLTERAGEMVSLPVSDEITFNLSLDR